MKRLIMILFVLFIIGGCGFLRYPEELDLFTSNISGNYWIFDIEKDNIPIFSLLLMKNKSDLNAISITLYKGSIPEQYSEFTKKTREVDFYDYPLEKKILWIKRNSKFEEPQVFNINAGIPFPDYFKDAFHYEAASIGIRKKWIKNFRSASIASYSNWTGYLAEYDLTGAKGIIPVSEDKGELLFFISPSHNKMIESYFSNNQWDYIRYVEGGEFHLDINEADPESMIKTIWDAWQEYILPYINCLDLEFFG